MIPVSTPLDFLLFSAYSQASFITFGLCVSPKDIGNGIIFKIGNPLQAYVSAMDGLYPFDLIKQKKQLFSFVPATTKIGPSFLKPTEFDTINDFKYYWPSLQASFPDE